MMLFQAAEANNSVNDLLSTLTASTLVVSIIQWLKTTKLVPFMDQHTSTLNRIVGWASAFATGAGIHFTFNHDAGVLTVTGLTAGVIIHTATITSKQYAVQWLIYKGIVKEPAKTEAAIAEGVRPVPVASPGAIKAGEEQAAKP
jgi:hypothetical protein